jgi:hypothetical protein
LPLQRWRFLEEEHPGAYVVQLYNSCELLHGPLGTTPGTHLCPPNHLLQGRHCQGAGEASSQDEVPERSPRDPSAEVYQRGPGGGQEAAHRPLLLQGEHWDHLCGVGSLHDGGQARRARCGGTPRGVGGE